MTRRSVQLLLLLIIVIGQAPRSYQLTARSLWFDEAFSWRLIQFPVGEMITRAAADVHPPLYYLLLKGWSYVFATSLLSLRSFSVVFAGLTIWIGYLFTSYALRSRGGGLLAAALLALSGWQIQFAWEARMYTLGTFLILLSSWFLLRAVRRHRLSDCLFYSTFAAAALYVHYYALFSLAAQLLFLVGYIIVTTRGRLGEILQWSFFWAASISVILIVLLFLPWLPTFVAQHSQVQASYWIPAIGGWSIPDTFYRMFIPTVRIPPHTGLSSWLLSLLPVTATVIGLISLIYLPLAARFARTADAAWLIFLSAVMPFFFSLLLSFIGQSLYQDRFFVFSHLFIVIALAALLLRLPFIRLRLTLSILVVIGFSAAFVAYWRELDLPNHPGARAAMAEIARQFKPADRIIAGSPFIYFAALHYAKEEHQLPQPKLFSVDGQLLHFSGGPILTADDITAPATLTQPGNIWVIDTTGFGSSPLTLPDRWQSLQTQAFPEVFAHQGEVIITYYQALK